MRFKRFVPFFLFVLLIASCMRYASNKGLLTVRESPATAAQNAKTIQNAATIKLAEGLRLSLWASDSLAPDPVAMSIDDRGRVFLTRTVRQKRSEFDIRGHQNWITASIGLQTVDDRRAFLRQTFAPERSKENEWLKDMNFDGSHDWRDLAVEREEIWCLEDRDRDGYADISRRVWNDPSDEVTDIAAGLLVRDQDMFLTLAPDVWRLEDKNRDGIPEKKTSISTGYGVHIGFSGHNLSGPVEGPDGRIYWNIGDIGGTVTTVDGKRFENPNSGFIARSNPDGSDFEIFATGLRNTHEFVFDDYGNLISSDNDGDHPGESERLVHVVEGSDAGWRSNWQYGKYTDPKNNTYKVWMDEKLFKPRWDGQAAYIIPPIMNYHNGPTGMVYNPGTALGSAWRNKFFLVEFVGTAAHSHIWSFGLKPKGASFVLDGETDVLSGILPTAIQFGPDGALYAADWINGWGTKNYGRVWKLDVAADKNDLAAQRAETQRLMLMDYKKQTPEALYALLFNADKRIRQKAQFELVRRGATGAPQLTKAATQTTHQLARLHGIWGLGQLARQAPAVYGPGLLTWLSDKDPEIAAQAAKMLGDADIKTAGPALIGLLRSEHPRLRFYAAEALGQLKSSDAVRPLIALLEANNDEDNYIRHAATLALARIGQTEPIIALASSPSRALRTAAVLVLRRLRHEQVALFLKDQDEYVATEAARAIHDDLSIPAALPALAAALQQPKFQSEAFLRRAISAALRVGDDRALSLLSDFARDPKQSTPVVAEALAALGTWANPSVMDRVDGRHRGGGTRALSPVQAKIRPHLAEFLGNSKPEVLIATAGMLANLEMSDVNDRLAAIYKETKDNKIKIAVLNALNRLHYAQMASLIQSGMEDDEKAVRVAALGLLDNSNVSKEGLPLLVKAVFGKGSIQEQQQLLAQLPKLSKDKTLPVLQDLMTQAKAQKLPPDLNLELREAVEASGDASLKAAFEALKPQASLMEQYADVLHGGNSSNGWGLFFYNSTAQCGRCHAIGTEGGKVGPNLSSIGKTLTRAQILEALIDPSARIAPGYGNVALTLKDGQTVYGVLAKEETETLTLTTSDAEPLVIPLARIAKRQNLPSSMPTMDGALSKREIRDLVAFLSTLEGK